ncbi:MAG: hypothetical protein FK733_18150 [Asgard group archaeon]|nr:hypothetical protein [Asgard group archaeon]
MSTLKEDAKDVGLSIAFDLMLVAFVVSWVAAILLALFEVSLWVVFGVFLVGCGIFFAMLYFSQKLESKEKEAEVTLEDEADTSELEE